MKTIGQYIRQARKELQIPLYVIEEKTKIRKSFLIAIENEDWTNLPEFPVVLGFVRSIADTLNIDRRQATALLRRDYPPQSLQINPKPDLSEKFTWNPRLTFFLSIAGVLVVVFAYLFFQYKAFSSPPSLSVESPQEGEKIMSQMLGVNGKTDPDAKVIVNDQPVLIDEFGNFYTELQVNESTTQIDIKSISRSGKETVIVRKVSVELE